MSHANLQEELSSLSVDELDRLTQNVLDETASTRPLLSTKKPLSELREEYERGSASFVKQIDFLKTNGYSTFRRAKGDGDCFYRSLGFAWIERLLVSSTQARDVVAAESLLSDSRALLLNVGFQALVFEDFYEVLADLIRQIVVPTRDGSKLTPSLLLEAFQDPEVSNSIVIYLRFLTSATIQLNPDEYEAFLLNPETGAEISIRDFCANFVEACGKEADHVQITALTKALRLNIQVAYLDGHGKDGTVNFVEFENGSPQGDSRSLVLLYRPGHYDILEKPTV